MGYFLYLHYLFISFFDTNNGSVEKPESRNMSLQ